MNRTFPTRGPDETRELGRRLGARIEPPFLMALDGPMGAGKTCFVRGIAEGLAIAPELVYSPSFTLIAEHSGRWPLHHVDLFRLPEPVDWPVLDEIGFEEILSGENVVVVEWFERLDPEIRGRLPVRVAASIHDRGGSDREIVLRPSASDRRIVEELTV